MSKQFDSAWLDKYERKHNDSKNRGNRPRPIVQKRQDDSARQTDNGPAQAKVDGRGFGNFGFSVEFLVSDERDRDGDGMLATVLDSYLAAIGRLLEMDRQALRNLAKSIERSGRRKN